jgi:hypothetical protein
MFAKPAPSPLFSSAAAEIAASPFLFVKAETSAADESHTNTTPFFCVYFVSFQIPDFFFADSRSTIPSFRNLKFCLSLMSKSSYEKFDTPPYPCDFSSRVVCVFGSSAQKPIVRFL